MNLLTSKERTIVLSGIKFLLPTFVLGASLLVIGGCAKGDRPQLGKVSGVVTLDGEPLANAGVMFRPDGLRSSCGITNTEGHYELKYLRNIKGAALGAHEVRIDVLPGENNRKIMLPKRYNRQSTLVADVEQGKNTINWELASE